MVTGGSFVGQLDGLGGDHVEIRVDAAFVPVQFEIHGLFGIGDCDILLSSLVSR